jgi:peptidoglycan hydrolase CwlO-like protein
MICKMVKKGVVGAVLGAGALALLFGTSAPSYVKTAFHRVRHSAKASVPIQFEIDRARQEVQDLEEPIHKNREAVAEAEVDIEHLQREILATRENLADEGRAIVALRSNLDSGNTLRTRGVTYTTEEVKNELARRYDHYKAVKKILGDREETLKIRDKNLAAAREQLQNMEHAKKALATKIEGIETRLRQIEATQSANEFTFDQSALAQAKKTVAELAKRVEVQARVIEAEGRLSDKGIPVLIEPSRDVLKEVDAEFGVPASDTARASTDKNL